MYKLFAPFNSVLFFLRCVSRYITSNTIIISHDVEYVSNAQKEIAIGKVSECMKNIGNKENCLKGDTHACTAILL